MLKTKITGQDIVDTARSYIDTRFKHLGRNRHGLDCIGLTVVVARDLGLKDVSRLPIPTYGRVPRPHLFEPGLRQCLHKCDYGEAKPGDILLFAIKKYPQHVAIYSEQDGVPYMIHAFSQPNKVVENRIDPDWELRMIGCWKWPELEETQEWLRSR